MVLCFGGEAKGLRARTRKVCDGLIGLPMLGLRSVEEGIAELQAAKDAGARGVMLSGNPAFSDRPLRDQSVTSSSCLVAISR